MKQKPNRSEARTELFKKIAERDDIEIKISNIENETKLSFGQLIDTNDEYCELCARKLDLEGDIDKLLIDTDYIPLVGLSDIEKQKIDFSHISHSVDYEEITENHLEMQFLNFRDDMKRRLKKLEGLYLTANPDKRIKRLYKEIIRCYIFDLCDASTALCRALVEGVAEEYCNQDKEVAKNLVAAKKFEKRKIISEALRKRLTKELYTIYSDIGKEGSSVLHDRLNKVSEDEALKTIENSQKFVNEIYKIPDFTHLIEEI